MPAYTGQYPSAWLEAEADAEYAFRLESTGLNAELGAGVAPGQFIGFEYQCFNSLTGPGQPEWFGWYRPACRQKQIINTYQGAYRFSLRIPPSPLSIYLGGSAGVAEIE